MTATSSDTAARWTDFGARVAAVVTEYFVLNKAEKEGRTFVVRDLYAGWDSLNLSIDSTMRRPLPMWCQLGWCRSRSAGTRTVLLLRATTAPPSRGCS